MKPLAIDLFCGLGGWAEGFLAEGYDVVGFDNHRHCYPSRKLESSFVKAGMIDFSRGDSFNGTTEKRLRQAPLTGGYDVYPAQLVIQDVLTLHGSQFRNAACIVASPPCQEFSYMAMPWTRAKQIAAALREKAPFPEKYTGSRTLADLTSLFDACFRIHREACEAAGRYIPMVVENVKGAQPWVGQARANFGSFYFWGDVDSVSGRVVAGKPQFGATLRAAKRGGKVDTYSDPRRNGGKTAHLTCQVENYARLGDGVKAKACNALFNDHKRARVELDKDSQMSYTSSHSAARKAASAAIAKIPFPLSSHIARMFYPR